MFLMASIESNKANSRLIKANMSRQAPFKVSERVYICMYVYDDIDVAPLLKFVKIFDVRVKCYNEYVNCNPFHLFELPLGAFNPLYTYPH